MRQQVIRRHCDEYDPRRIATILPEGMAALNVWPHGQVLVKPNLATPHRRFFAHSFTRPKFMDGLLQAMRVRGADITELSVGERSGMGIPSRLAFANAEYLPALRHHHARVAYLDERPAMPIRCAPTLFIIHPVQVLLACLKGKYSGRYFAVSRE